MESLTELRVRPITPAVGAVIEGADLARPLPPHDVTSIRHALVERGVVFFRGQDLSDAQMHAFAAQLGEPMPEPFANASLQGATPVTTGDLEKSKFATAVWHSDTSFVPEPPTFTALRAVTLPECGGDTCWASMYAAYEALSAPLRAMLDGLSGVHSIAPVLRRMAAQHAADHQDNAATWGREHTHPLVRVHPETGRRALFYNEGWVTRIPELTQAESDHLLALLREHVKAPEFAMRWQWRENDVAIWDNRCVQHYAVPDYATPRVMQRVVTRGERPVGPQDRRS